ncbi:MAG: glycosyltransferase family 39 protein [Anaerolineae bacterium]|nr:glycosyltransferase family 39 protein [Anaerolineae bacterium]
MNRQDANHTRIGRGTAALVLALCLFAFGMSGLVSRTVFERLPHLEDELAYQFQARVLARGQMVIESPDPARPFWQPFVTDRDGLRFGKYSLGWPGLLALGVVMGQPWVVNAFLSALTVALVYRLGREVFDPDTGLIAAALTAFSPMALLLNGTLMSHTAALCTATLFLYAFWRLERSPHWLRWGLLAGIALGLTLLIRPLAAVALAAPFMVWSLIWLLKTVERQRGRLFRGLVMLSMVTLGLGTLIPIYNAAATGNPGQNLYLLTWPYDRVGFGEGYGRNGHTLEKGVRQTRWDLSLTAADLFGWQTGTMFGADGQIDPGLRQHLRNDAVYWPNTGLSWVLLPFGLLIGLGRRWWLWGVWLAVGAAAFMLTTNLPVDTLRSRDFALVWMGAAVVWWVIPFGFLVWKSYPGDARPVWTWLLLAVALGLIGLHIAYWIGSQRYSTRYYFEALTALALLSAIPLGWLARRIGRWPVIVLVALALGYSLFAYSTPRVTALYRFNWVSPALIEAVERRRVDDRPVLVIVSGTDVKWRSYGSLMSSTGPFLDTPIVAAWDNQREGVRAAILARFPDRQVIEMTATGNQSCFVDAPTECYGEGIDAGP